jgi:hypothetical protein
MERNLESRRREPDHDDDRHPEHRDRPGHAFRRPYRHDERGRTLGQHERNDDAGREGLMRSCERFRGLTIHDAEEREAEERIVDDLHEPDQAAHGGRRERLHGKHDVGEGGRGEHDGDECHEADARRSRASRPAI